ncbi:MAG: GntR family transcriptional regulator [Lachnospiraceae bacterium]|jgi:DNA-binding GntR family transcriptional regulator|nr:GntR family transcriptional regulator [Lachnospiraceae bacterium]MCI9382930.1 GntR family transcriptional regulator [Lachnospiraceae bacterium]MCI9624776.1 GntR family transcriptional regulator [Lachnospiraceae bacterium]
MKVKSNLDVIIYDHIVDSLILGEYQMGQTILLDEFANKYEVSRTPVTQAVRLLANDGLLEMMKNGRVMVPVFEEEQMAKICEVRLLMEEFAIEKILGMEQADDAFYDLLDDIAVKGIQALHMDDKLQFNKKDLEFHRTLIAKCGNEYLTAEYKRIQGKFIVANYLILPLEERNFEKAAKSHVQLVKLMRDHDLAGSLKKMKEHIFSFSAPF